MLGGLLALTAVALTVVGTGDEQAIEGLDALPIRAAGMVVEGKPAVAVLPFANMSADEGNEFFTQGIHDDILTQLSKIGSLDVIARTSVMQYLGTTKTIPAIGEELGVQAVVEGGVQRAGGRVRINVQLIEAQSGTHLWAETYNRELTAENVFAIQSEITTRIAEGLRMTLSPEEGDRISQAPTTSLTAYDFYLKGREAYGRYTAEDNDEAIRLFRQALALDPDYARAWAGLGDAFGLRVANYGLPIMWADSAMAASRRAIEIDPDLPDGHKALGLTYRIRGEYRQALRNYLRTVELDPSHLTAVSSLDAIYFSFGAFDEYHYWSMRAFRLSPNYRLRRTQVAWSYWQLGDYDLAERWALEALALEPDDLEAMQVLSAIASLRGEFEQGMEVAERAVLQHPTSAYALQGSAGAALFNRDFDRVRSAAEEALRLDPNLTSFHWHYSGTTLGFALLRTGETERGMSMLAETLAETEASLERNDSWGPVWEMASIHAARGERDEALRWAEQAYESRGYRFPYFIAIDPIFDGVRNDPRFRTIVARMTADVEGMRRRIEQEEVAAGVR